MSTYSEFFLKSARSNVQLELLEISHPSFSTVYRKVRNARKGVTVTLEDASSKTFDFAPMKITSGGAKDDLDNSLDISFGDLGEILPLELDRIKQDGSYKTKPTVKYRVYSSGNLTAPLYGPVTFNVKAFNFKREGATFKASAPELNYSATGLLYRIDQFPMLRGAL